MTTIQLITENPFRMMGVYANAPVKEILASKSKMLAFAKVGKTLPVASDLLGNLPPVTRSAELIAEAYAKLNTPEDRIRYAQFWFCKTDDDAEALGQLQNGDVDNALQIWSRRETISSLQNQMVCHLLQDNFPAAIAVAERLYGQYGDEYVRSVDPTGALQLTVTELSQRFIDAISQQVDLFSILESVQSSDWQEHIRSFISRSAMNELTCSLERLRGSDTENLEAYRKAGEQLMLASKEPLRKLRKILPENDFEYQVIADKVSNEILNCSIEYINHSKLDPYDAVANTFDMIKYAKNTAVGNIVKQRCVENYKLVLPLANKTREEYHDIVRAPFYRKVKRYVILGIALVSGVLIAVVEGKFSGFWTGLLISIPFCSIANRIMNLYE